MRERLRWRIAHLLDRLPGQCWTNLACWAGRHDEKRLPWFPVNDQCRAGIERNGSCYCNKLKAGGPRD